MPLPEASLKIEVIDILGIIDVEQAQRSLFIMAWFDSFQIGIRPSKRQTNTHAIFHEGASSDFSPCTSPIEEISSEGAYNHQGCIIMEVEDEILCFKVSINEGHL